MPKPFTERAKMRVEVAKDVIAALNSKRITPDSTYMRVFPEQSPGYYEQFPERTLRKEAWKELTKQYRTPKRCQACGIGALFIAAVDRFDKLQVKDLYDKNDFSGYSVSPELDVTDMVPYLSKWFSARQLVLIEVAFEGNEVRSICAEPSEVAIERAKRFHEHTKELHVNTHHRGRPSRPETTMRAIMENIIKNKGEFRP